jgi:DtxR family Mn-dependent transcriptional regulator
MHPIISVMHSLSEENYLKAIYSLAREGAKKITPTSIAEELHNNPASVIDMLKKLGDKKLLSYDKVKGAKLTEKGTKTAIEIVRKHRLWEVFLLEKLGYSWDEVHDIAEQLEHIHHIDLADRLDKFLGYPNYDPHGDPIPDKNGKLPATKWHPLSEIEIGRKVKVVNVDDNSPDFLKYLAKQEIALNSIILIKEIQNFDKSLLVELKGKREIYLSPEAAKKIFVE